MASPPSSISLPQKRPSLSLPSASQKRRKQSTGATIGPSQLRQTSFPPEASPTSHNTPLYSRSPSVETTTTSLANGTAGGGVGSRKRRRTATDVDGRSTAGTSAIGKSGSAMSVVEGEEEGEEDGDDVEVEVEGGKMDEAAEKQAAERLNLLMRHLSHDQLRRYDIYRRVKLKKEIVRRITNQTLSQSVPASVITTINGYTKLFIGTLIDRARSVQAERAYDKICLPPALSISPENAPPLLVRALIPLLSPHQLQSVASPATTTSLPGLAPAQNGAPGTPTLQSPLAQQQHSAQHNSPYPPAPPPGSATSPTAFAATTPQHLQSPAHPSYPAPSAPTHHQPPRDVVAGYTANRVPRLAPAAIACVESQSRAELFGGELGPLEPDHLREALRRYKKGREGAGAGFVGLSLEGKESVAVRAGGKRLFR